LAEQAVLKAAGEGLPAVVLRPACVYGPFSNIFITRPLEALPDGRFHLLGAADGASNTVYIDNLIESLVRCLDAPAEKVKGEVFTISEPDQPSWREFYEYFASELGYRIPTVPLTEKCTRRPAGIGLRTLLWPVKLLRACGSVLTSAEFRALGQRMLQTDPLGTCPRWMLQRFPRLRQWVRRLVKADDLTIYRRPTAAGEQSGDTVELGASKYFVSCEKATRVLDYKPPISRQRGMELTLAWVRYARLVPPKAAASPRRSADATPLAP
jgi:nucleoside-diphosphate-sugar epimerase